MTRVQLQSTLSGFGAFLVTLAAYWITDNIVVSAVAGMSYVATLLRGWRCIP